VNLEFVLQFTALSDKCLDRDSPTEITTRFKKCPFPKTWTKEIQDRLKWQTTLTTTIGHVT